MGKGDTDPKDRKIYRILFEKSLNPIMIVDENGRYIDANKSALQFLECSLDELKEKKVWDFAPPELLEQQKKGHSPFLKPRTLEVNYLVHGRIKTLLLNISPVTIEGKMLLYGIGQDITGRKEMKKELRKSQDKYDRFINTANEGVWAMDENHLTTFVNQRMADMLKYAPAEIIGKQVERFMFPEDLHDHTQKMEIRHQGGRQHYERRFCCKDGSELWTIVSATSMTDADGTFRGSFAMFTDITERKKTEEALRKSEELYRAIFEGTTDAIVVLDTKRQMLACNNAFCVLMGRDRDDVIGKSTRIFHASDELYREFARTVYPVAAGTGHARVEWDFMRKDGTIFPSEVVLSVLKDDKGGYAGSIGIIRDISERRQAEEALRESEARYRAVIEGSADCIVLFKDGEYIYANRKLANTLGYKSSEEIIGKRIGAFLHPDDHERVIGYHTKRARGEPVPSNYETRVIKKDGSIIHFEVSAGSIILKGERVIIGFLRDITERKKLEQALRDERDFAETLVETAQAIVLVLDTEGRIVRFNQFLEEIAGYRLNEVLGKDWFTTFLPPQYRNTVKVLFRKAVGDTRTRGNVNPIITRDGREVEIAWYDKTLKDKDGNVIGLLCIGLDITELKRYEQQLTTSLKEKEVLLSEVHHRVKNNLQIILSLLDLQERTLRDATPADVLREARARVRSISLAHETLYQSENFSNIDMREYANFLTRYLFGIYGIDPARISIDIDFQDIAIDIGNSVPLGLIINELVTNALKHAFPGAKKGVISLSLQKKNGKFICIVSDNGVGLPGPIDLGGQETLGLQIVDILVRQIKGTVEIVRDRGTAFVISFPVES